MVKCEAGKMEMVQAKHLTLKNTVWYHVNKPAIFGYFFCWQSTLENIPYYEYYQYYYGIIPSLYDHTNTILL